MKPLNYGRLGKQWDGLPTFTLHPPRFVVYLASSDASPGPVGRHAGHGINCSFQWSAHDGAGSPAQRPRLRELWAQPIRDGSISRAIPSPVPQFSLVLGKLFQSLSLSSPSSQRRPVKRYGSLLWRTTEGHHVFHSKSYAPFASEWNDIGMLRHFKHILQ